MAFDIQEALQSTYDNWTPERIAASIPLDTLSTVYSDTSCLVQAEPTLNGDEHAAKLGVSDAESNQRLHFTQRSSSF